MQEAENSVGLVTVQLRAVASGPAGPVLAGPVFRAGRGAVLRVAYVRVRSALVGGARAEHVACYLPLSAAGEAAGKLS